VKKVFASSAVFAGFLALVVSLLAVGAGAYYKVPVTVVYKKFFKVMTAAVVFSFFLSFFLYIKSRFVPQSKLAAPGNSGILADETVKLQLKLLFESYNHNLCDWKLYIFSENTHRGHIQS